MRRLWNWFGRTVATSGRAARAGFGATVDMLVRYIWATVIPLALGIVLAMLFGSSWWLSIFGIIAILFMVRLSFSVKGFWAIGFLFAVDIARKALPKKVRAHYPGIDYDDFRLLRLYIRTLVFLALSLGGLLLLYSLLPIWEEKILVSIQLLAFLLYAISTTARQGWVLRAFCFLFIAGSTAYIATHWSPGLHSLTGAMASRFDRTRAWEAEKNRVELEMYKLVTETTAILDVSRTPYRVVDEIPAGAVLKQLDNRVMTVDGEPYWYVCGQQRPGSFTGSNRGWAPMRVLKPMPTGYREPSFP